MSTVKEDKLKELISFSKTLKVLYVEDNEDARNSTLKFLENIFTNITIAVDGKDGLEKFKEKKFAKDEILQEQTKDFDLILSDINMPKMNGIEMIEKIRDIDSEIPILILSAHDETNYFLDLIKLGVDGFSLKPIVLHQFMKLVMKTVDKINLKVQNEEYKNNLEKKVEEEIDKREDQEILLAQSTKMAAIGEMVDSIAHQWMQPINIIKMNTQIITYGMDKNYSEYDKIKECTDAVVQQTEHLTTTLYEFRDFFKNNKNKEDVSIASVVKSVLLLLKDTLIKNLIETEVEIDETIKIVLYPNEFKHILINMINNAKDQFIEKNIKDRKIKFILKKDNNSIILEIEDNAGGIRDEIIDDIFKANTTTKDEGKGSGVGLYMSQLIAQKNGAKIGVKNANKGAIFTIKFN